MYHDCVTELAQMLEGRAAVCPSARASRAYLMREGRVLFVQESKRSIPVERWNECLHGHSQAVKQHPLSLSA